MKANPSLTLALQGTSRGFGYVLMEGPFTAHDWGTVTAKGDKNAVCLKKLAVMLDRHAPSELLLESSGRGGPSERIAAFYRVAAALAAARGVEVHAYPFQDVRACFRKVGAETRQEIAEAVARSVASLSDWVPKPRKAWESDHRRMSVFCAAAMVLTHFEARTVRLFDDLKQGEAGEAAEA